MLSIIFLTHSRSDLLAISIETMRTAMKRLPDLEFEILISDDASAAEHRQRIATLGADRVVSSERNRGLSHNHNQAIRACRNEVILSLQDDWEFVGDPQLICSALEVLARDLEVGQVNFIRPTRPLPGARRHLPGGVSYFVFDNDGKPRRRLGWDRPYSDRPHMKRAGFARDLGPYREDLPMTAAELDFQRRVACQQRWKVAYLENDLSFRHLGGERSFNPAVLQAQRLEQTYRLPVVGPAYREARRVARLCRNWLTARSQA